MKGYGVHILSHCTNKANNYTVSSKHIYDNIEDAHSAGVYDNYFLLSHSEVGHVFRNRLVHYDYIHEEDFP